MPNILVLCRANQFRSALAEYALRRQLASAEWRVTSAGVWAEDGLPAARGLAVWSEMPELEQHRSRALDLVILQESDLILVMEAGQKEAVLLEFPGAAGRVHLLSEMSQPLAYDLPDPALGGENPRQLAAEILMLVEKGLARIIQLAEANAASRPG